MNREASKVITLTDILNVVRRRKWLLIICLVGIVTAVMVYNKRATPIYRGASKVIFEDNEKVMDYNMFGALNKANYITNQIEEMKTKSFAEEIYASLDSETRNKFLTLKSYSPQIKPKAFTISQIKENLSFDPIKGTEIITIMFDSENRHLAMEIANSTANVLIRRNLKIRRQQYSNVKKFIDEQFEIVKRRLEEAENALKEFKEDENITSIEAESREILTRVTQAEIVYNEVRSNKNELEERLSVIRGKLNSEKEGLSENVINTTSPLAVKQKEKLVELEITYSNLQVQGFPEDNPKMVELKDEIEQVKKNLIQETIKINEEDNMESLMDPFSQIRKYLEESISLEVELQALEAKEKNLRLLLANYSQTLRTLPEKELSLVRLMRDKEVNDKLYMTLLEEREAARIKEASEIGNIRILEPARLPLAPIYPQKVLNLVAGVLGAIFLGTFLIFLFEYLNDRIRTQDDVERDLGFPVIAVIPKGKKEIESLFEFDSNRKITSSFYDSIFFDAYNLLSFGLEKKPAESSTVMLTSSIPDEGKSTISSMLAITSAQRGKRTLLIDADLRKPTLNALFKVPREPGLTNLVIEMTQIQRRQASSRNNNGSLGLIETQNGQADNENMLKSQMIQTSIVEGLIQTFEKNLLFLPSGFIPANPVRIWSSQIWSRIFQQLSSIVDLIIIDAPPIIGVAETTMMASHVDHVLFCVAAETVDKKTLKRSFKMFTDSIPQPEEKILGVVLNKADMVHLYGGYKYYKYYTKKDKTRKAPETPSFDFTMHNR